MESGKVKQGTTVGWRTKHGWQFGRFDRIITKGKHKGKAEVKKYGTLLPEATFKVDLASLVPALKKEKPNGRKRKRTKRVES